MIKYLFAFLILSNTALAGLSLQKQAGFGLLVKKQVESISTNNAGLGCVEPNRIFTLQQIVEMHKNVIQVNKNYSATVEDYQYGISNLTSEDADLTVQLRPGSKYMDDLELLFPSEEIVNPLGNTIKNYLSKNCSNLSFPEFYSIFVYTQYGYEQINNWPKPKSAYSNIAQIRKNLSSALNKLPIYKGTVYMGTYLDQEAIQNILSSGLIQYEENFVSGSATTGYREFISNAVIIFKSKSGRTIESVTSVPGEDEILFKPGVRLKVKSIRYDPEEKSSITLYNKKSFQGIYFIDAEEI